MYLCCQKNIIIQFKSVTHMQVNSKPYQLLCLKGCLSFYSYITVRHRYYIMKPEPVMIYCQWTPRKFFQGKSNKNQHFSRKCIWKYGPFCSSLNVFTECVKVLSPYWLISQGSSRQSAHYCGPSWEDFFPNDFDRYRACIKTNNHCTNKSISLWTSVAKLCTCL